MSENPEGVVITVSGSASTSRAPEIATVSVTVRADGPDRGPVIETVQRISGELRAQLEALKGEGAVSEWSSARISVWADRPWSDEGRRLPKVQYASLPVTAEFTDFEKLEEWLSPVAQIPEVEVAGPWWGLLDESRVQVEAEVAAEAINAALAKAKGFAAAIGRQSVDVVELTDDPSGAVGPGAAVMRMGAPMGAFASADDVRISFDPRDIDVEITVRGRFMAR